MAKAQNKSSADELKHRAILAHFRKKIVENMLKPGERLPTRREIGSQFAAGPVTVQRALDLLLNDGFVTADGRRGTFVDLRPPHLYRYALALPTDGLKNSLYARALVESARRISREQGIRINVFHDINGHTDVPDYVRLMADAQAHRLAGIILTSATDWVRNSPLAQFSEKRVPRVALSHPLEEIETIDTDQLGFIKRAVQLGRERGGKRVAVLAPARSPTESTWVDHHFMQAAAENGLELLVQNIQFVNTTTPFTASRAVEGIMNAPASSRPDILIISEDNLVAFATEGLSAMGLTEKDVTVIAYANFPCPAQASFPITSVGIDTKHVLQAAIERLRAQANGERATTRSRRIPVILESEVGIATVEEPQNLLDTSTP